jgi:aryl-alcohol dehydrogenase-like predicted oxidoreductase
MDMRTLGRTGVKVSPLCLGTMMFGAKGNSDHDDCIRIIHAALDAGVNFVDTADSYSAGETEEIVAKALVGRRDSVFLATKVHSPMGSDPNHRGNSRRWLATAIENSLRRLGTDHVDLYQIHRPDPDTAIEETLEALTDLQTAGKIRYFGTSAFPASFLVQARWAAREHRTRRFATNQPPYSMLVRGIEREVLPVCEEYGLGVLTYGPLAAGWLSGRYRKGEEIPDTGRRILTPGRFDLSQPENQAKLEAADALGALADEAKLSLVHLALAFVLNHPAVTSAIIGPRTMDQLTSQLLAPEVVLPRDILDRIDEIVPPGTTINAFDDGWDPPSITDSRRRRRLLS